MVGLSYDDLDHPRDRHLVRVRLGHHAVLDLLNGKLDDSSVEIELTSSAVHSATTWWSKITSMTTTTSAASIVSTCTSIVLIE